MTVLSPSNCISFAGKRVAAYRAGIIAILIIIRFFARVKLQYLGKHLVENKFHLLYLKGLELSATACHKYSKLIIMQTSELMQSYLVDANTWDEMYTNATVREHYKTAVEFLEKLSIDDLNKREEFAKRLFMSQGVTFTVYSSGEGIEKIFPFDIIPRIITASEWDFIEKGIKQRLKALNLFLKDVYHQQFILKDGIVTVDLIYSCPHYLREMQGVNVPHDIYVHIAGIDLIRDHDGTFYVQEDNLRTPSGVSYMIENREITKRIFPDLIPQNHVRPVTQYPNILYKNLKALSPRQIASPNIVLLTPGIYNSAYLNIQP